jgi:hypothetical protein
MYVGLGVSVKNSLRSQRTLVADVKGLSRDDSARVNAFLGKQPKGVK